MVLAAKGTVPPMVLPPTLATMTPLPALDRMVDPPRVVPIALPCTELSAVRITTPFWRLPAIVLPPPPIAPPMELPEPALISTPLLLPIGRLAPHAVAMSLP